MIFIGVSASNNTGKDNSFGSSRLFSIIGIIGLIFINALLVFFVWQENNSYISNRTVGYILVFSFYVIMSLMGWYLTLKGFIWKITLGETKLIYRNCIGITYCFDYCEIKEIRVFYVGQSDNIEKVKIYVKGKIVEVSYLDACMITFPVQLKNHISKKMRKEYNILFTEVRSNTKK